MPNTWYAVGSLLTDGIVCLQLLAMPLKLHRSSSSEVWDLESSGVWSKHWMLVVFCLIVVASSFVVSCAYWLPWSMIGVLLNPFATGVDAYNTDALLASTDRALFVSMRALFDPKAAPAPETFLDEESSLLPRTDNSSNRTSFSMAASNEELSVPSRTSLSEQSCQSISGGFHRLGRFHTRLPVKVVAIGSPEEPRPQTRRRKTGKTAFGPRERQSKTIFEVIADPAKGLDPAPL